MWRVLTGGGGDRHLLDGTPVDGEDAVGRGEAADVRGGGADQPLDGHQAVGHLLHPLHLLVDAEQPGQAGGELGDRAERRRRHQDLLMQEGREHRLRDALLLLRQVELAAEEQVADRALDLVERQLRGREALLEAGRGRRG